jgi:hypothetical protein
VFSRIAVVGLAAIAAWCMYLSIDRSGMPSHYYAYFREASRFTYPTRDVALWSAAIAIEAGVALWFLWCARSVPAMCVVLALLFAPGVIVLGPLAMHAPPYFGAHLVFLFLAEVWFVVAALATWIARFAKRRAAC